MVATIFGIPTGAHHLTSTASTSVADCYAAHLAKLAKQALWAEANLTPKPALVDRRGAGAHRDLSLDLMRRSADVLEPFFAQMARTAAGCCIPNGELFDKLRLVGCAAEDAMFAVTDGSNTHKGAIWSLGLLVAAASMQTTAHRKAVSVAGTAGSIASFTETTVEETLSHGSVVQQRFAVTGARGEAQQGFPHVIGVGLPVLRRRRAEGADENIARMDCLLSIMSHLDDTCLLYRAGLPGLSTAQVGGREILAAGGAGAQRGLRQLHQLHEQLLQLNCSPGGSADLLSATLFLDAFENRHGDIECVTATIVEGT